MLKRIFLLTGAIGWGISLPGVRLPWRVMDVILRNMGAAGPVTDPMIRYHYRMAAAGWSVIGFFFLAAFLFPERYRRIVPLLAAGTLFEGVVLLAHGLILGVPLFPFAGDVGFCLVTGGGLFLTSGFGRVRYPLLTGRAPDASAWRLEGVDPAVTAAYLEAVFHAFDRAGPRDLFRLRPEDSLFDLYDSHYKTGRRTCFLLGTDAMELEECAVAFDGLCRFSGAEFDCRSSLRDLLRTIALNREDQPPSAEEIASLRLTLRFLPYIVR